MSLTRAAVGVFMPGRLVTPAPFLDALKLGLVGAESRLIGAQHPFDRLEGRLHGRFSSFTQAVVRPSGHPGRCAQPRSRGKFLEQIAGAPEANV